MPFVFNMASKRLIHQFSNITPLRHVKAKTSHRIHRAPHRLIMRETSKLLEWTSALVENPLAEQ